MGIIIDQLDGEIIDGLGASILDAEDGVFLNSTTTIASSITNTALNIQINLNSACAVTSSIDSAALIDPTAVARTGAVINYQSSSQDLINIPVAVPEDADYCVVAVAAWDSGIDGPAHFFVDGSINWNNGGMIDFTHVGTARWEDSGSSWPVISVMSMSAGDPNWPGSGSQTLYVNFNGAGAMDEGANIGIVFFKNVDQSASIVDVDIQNYVETGFQAGSLVGVGARDLSIGCSYGYPIAPNADPIGYNQTATIESFYRSSGLAITEEAGETALRIDNLSTGLASVFFALKAIQNTIIDLASTTAATSSIADTVLNIRADLNSTAAATSSIADTVLNIRADLNSTAAATSSIADTVLNIRADLNSTIAATSSIADVALDIAGTIDFASAIVSTSSIADAALNSQIIFNSAIEAISSIIGVTFNNQINFNSTIELISSVADIELVIINPVRLKDSSFIPINAAIYTTRQLGIPAGKLESAFQPGRITDDTNPIASYNPNNEGFAEFEICIEIDQAMVATGDQFEFRITNAGTQLGAYTVIPSLIIGTNDVLSFSSATTVQSSITSVVLNNRNDFNSTSTITSSIVSASLDIAGSIDFTTLAVASSETSPITLQVNRQVISSVPIVSSVQEANLAVTRSIQSVNGIESNIPAAPLSSTVRFISDVAIQSLATGSATLGRRLQSMSTVDTTADNASLFIAGSIDFNSLSQIQSSASAYTVNTVRPLSSAVTISTQAPAPMLSMLLPVASETSVASAMAAVDLLIGCFFTSEANGQTIFPGVSLDIFRPAQSQVACSSNIPDLSIDILRTIISEVQISTEVTSATLYVEQLGTVLKPTLLDLSPSYSARDMTSQLSLIDKTRLLKT